MTRRGIEKTVAVWVKRLGLTHWDIEIPWDRKEWNDEVTSSSETCQAFTWRARDYEQAKIYFNPDAYRTWSAVKTHQVVVHELLHLVTREVEFVLDLLESQLHRDVDSIISEAHKHAVEGMVDRLAYRLVDLAGVE